MSITDNARAIIGKISEGFTSLTGEIESIEQLYTRLQTEKDRIDRELLSAQGDIAHVHLEKDRVIVDLINARARIAELEEQLALLSKDPIDPSPPTNPPIIVTESARDVEIILSNVGTFKRTGDGELWPQSGERRFFSDLSPEVRAIADIKGPQVKVILQRAWGDLPLSAPVLESLITVKIDGKIRYTGSNRLHHHTRPQMTFDRLPLADAMRKDKLIPLPNYDPSAYLSPDLLENIALGSNWLWERWEQVATKDGTDFDPFTERYGYAHRSWTGGIPSTNEGSFLPPWSVALLLTGDKRIHQNDFDTAETLGNYPIHFYDRSTGKPYRPEDSLGLPVLIADGLPKLTSRDGRKLPVADLAHNFGLPNLAALLTGERSYCESIATMNLVGSLARKGGDRTSGIYWSGQVRAVDWWLRDLFHLCLVSVGDEKKYYENQLKNNLRFTEERFTKPGISPEYRETGIISIAPYKYGDQMRHFADGITQMSSIGQVYILAGVLGEILAAGYKEAEPMLRHTLRVVKGVWDTLATNPPAPLSRYLAPWTIVAWNGVDRWFTILDRTFAKLPSTPQGFNETKLTPDYVAWWRKAVISAVELGEPWAPEILKWTDSEMKRWGKGIPLGWAILPREK